PTTHKDIPVNRENHHFGARGIGLQIGEGIEHRARNQRSEIRRQRSGVKLISDLRLLTSMIDDFYDLNDLTN
ncbi:MAG: hypothetical protein ABUK19_09165, partial [Desulfobacteria bacterium]